MEEGNKMSISEMQTTEPVARTFDSEVKCCKFWMSEHRSCKAGSDWGNIQL
jgi:hypothetical protein